MGAGQSYETVADFRKAVNPEGLRFYRVKQEVTITINFQPVAFHTNEIYLMAPRSSREMPWQFFEEVPGDETLLNRPYRGEDLTGKRVLVMRSGGIGDLLFIQPSLRYLKKRYPTCRFWFATAISNLPLVSGWDCVSEAIPLPLPLKKLQECDYFMNFYGLIEFCRDAERQNAYFLFAEFWGLTGLGPEYLRPVLEARKPRVKTVQKTLAALHLERGFVYLQVRTSAINRTPQLSIFFVLMEKLLRLGIPVAICDQACDSAKMDVIIAAFWLIQRNKKSPLTEHPERLVNLSSISRDLQDMIAIISQSRFVIAPDSSSLHIAGGLGIPFYGIFTSFPAELRVATYPEAHYSQPQFDDAICKYGGRHCFLHSDAVCPALVDDRPDCFLKQINVEEIVEVVRKYFPEAPRSAIS